MAPFQNVATLLTDSSRADLDDRPVETVSGALDHAGAEIVAIHWLGENIACDVVFTGLERDAAWQALTEAGAGPQELGFDVVVQRRQGRRKDMLIATMDFGILNCDSLDGIGVFMDRKPQLAAITEQARAGTISEETALREKLALLQGVSVEALVTGFEQLEMRRGARALVQTMRAHGAWTVMVTPGPDRFSEPVRDAAGFHELVTGKLEIAGAMISGKMEGPVIDQATKQAALVRVAAEKSIPHAEVLALGAGASDLPMLDTAGLGVLFQPPPGLAAGRATVLRHADLTGLLYLQGYSQEEFRE